MPLAYNGVLFTRATSEGSAGVRLSLPVSNIFPVVCHAAPPRPRFPEPAIGSGDCLPH